MAEGSIVTPSRIKLARLRRGMDRIAFARALGLRTTRAVYAWESGRSQPSGEMLERIAEATRFPVGFFYRPAIELPTWHTL